MPINKNHEFEELDGVKCGIVEKNASADRVAFLKKLLEFNTYTVVVVSSPAPKVAAVKPVSIEAGSEPVAPDSIPAVEIPETFTVGVTDYTFNAVNAIFGRLLLTPDGHIVTQAYWQQRETSSHDEIPYYEHTK